MLHVPVFLSLSENHKMCLFKTIIKLFNILCYDPVASNNINEVCCLEARRSESLQQGMENQRPFRLIWGDILFNCKMGSNSSHKAEETRVDIVISFWVACFLRCGLALSTAAAFRSLGTAQGRGCLRSLQLRCEVCERMKFMQELSNFLFVVLFVGV